MVIQTPKAIDIQLVRRVLSYDPVEGVLRWKYRGDRGPQWNARFAGQKAGNKPSRHGYGQVGLDYRMYLSHRLAWAIFYGEQPPDEIDHKNRDRGDIRISNLRAATRSQNKVNIAPISTNKSGINGVSSCRGRWRARLKKDGKESHLGVFDTIEEAAMARSAAAIAAFGEFAR